MERIIIAAMTAERVIGSGDGMPWDLPEEYAHFLETVRGHSLIMGRRTWQIFGGDVASAHNIVVTHSSWVSGAEVAGSLDAALELAAGYGDTVFIAGGGSIYTQALIDGVVDAMYLSTIKGDYDGDIYFPTWDEADWETVQREDRGSYIFTHYRRR